jgi:hypothetical protein
MWKIWTYNEKMLVLQSNFDIRRKYKGCRTEKKKKNRKPRRRKKKKQRLRKRQLKCLQRSRIQQKSTKAQLYNCHHQMKRLVCVSYEMIKLENIPDK